MLAAQHLPLPVQRLLVQPARGEAVTDQPQRAPQVVRRGEGARVVLAELLLEALVGRLVRRPGPPGTRRARAGRHPARSRS